MTPSVLLIYTISWEFTPLFLGIYAIWGKIYTHLHHWWPGAETSVNPRKLSACMRGTLHLGEPMAEKETATVDCPPNKKGDGRRLHLRGRQEVKSSQVKYPGVVRHHHLVGVYQGPQHLLHLGPQGHLGHRAPVGTHFDGGGSAPILEDPPSVLDTVPRDAAVDVVPR